MRDACFAPVLGISERENSPVTVGLNAVWNAISSIRENIFCCFSEKFKSHFKKEAKVWAYEARFFLLLEKNSVIWEI